MKKLLRRAATREAGLVGLTRHPRSYSGAAQGGINEQVVVGEHLAPAAAGMDNKTEPADDMGEVKFTMLFSTLSSNR
jgi:hypothetical protein